MNANLRTARKIVADIYAECMEIQSKASNDPLSSEFAANAHIDVAPFLAKMRSAMRKLGVQLSDLVDYVDEATQKAPYEDIDERQMFSDIEKWFTSDAGEEG